MAWCQQNISPWDDIIGKHCEALDQLDIWVNLRAELESEYGEKLPDAGSLEMAKIKELLGGEDLPKCRRFVEYLERSAKRLARNHPVQHIIDDMQREIDVMDVNEACNHSKYMNVRFRTQSQQMR